MDKLWIIIIILFSFLLFFYRSVVSLDPDFGWHLRMGEIILHKGIPKTDPFSYTMPSYPFVDHEWLTNTFIAFVYPHIGKIGLAIIFSFFPLAALLITIKSFWKEPSRSLLLVSATIFALFSGIRVQVITWFFFSLLLFVVNNPIYWKKFRWFLPVLFLLWVNMHAGFAIGIVTLGIAIATDFWERLRYYDIKILREERKGPVFPPNIIISQYPNIFVFILSILATFLNPYGYRIWWEVWMQFSDASLHWTISEWMPTLINSLQISMWFFLAFSLVLFVIYRKKFTVKEIILYVFFFLFGEASLRNFPLWILVALPMLTQCFNFFIDKAKKYRFGKERAGVLLKGFSFLVFITAIAQTSMLIGYINTLSESSFYPENAVHFLHSNFPAGNIFSSYDWGGYLLWKLPEKKVFIDGRMPSWRWKGSSSGESDYAFRDYLNAGSKKLPLNTVIEKYHITVFLLPSNIEKKETKKTSRTLSKGKTASLPEELKRSGFKKIYQDKVAIIWKYL